MDFIKIYLGDTHKLAFMLSPKIIIIDSIKGVKSKTQIAGIPMARSLRLRHS